MFFFQNVKPGMRWQEVIPEAVSHSTHFFIFLSPDWKKSRPCREEFNYANRLNHEKNTPKIVPIIMGKKNFKQLNDDPMIGMILANNQGFTIEKNSDSWKKDLVRLLKTKLYQEKLVDTDFCDSDDTNVYSQFVRNKKYVRRTGRVRFRGRSEVQSMASLQTAISRLTTQLQDIEEKLKSATNIDDLYDNFRETIIKLLKFKYFNFWP